jgi:hypothetical protein
LAGRLRVVNDELIVLVGRGVPRVEDRHAAGDFAHHGGLAPGEGQAEGRDALEVRGWHATSIHPVAALTGR